MLTAYIDQGMSLVAVAAPDAGTLQAAVWIDLFQPTTEEEKRVEDLLGIDIPTRDEMREVETSSQLYREGVASFITLRALSREPGKAPRLTAITLVRSTNVFVTVRYADPTSFRNFVTRATKLREHMLSPLSAMICFAETVVDRDADLLEEASDNLDRISAQIFAQDTAGMSSIGATDLNHVLRWVGQSGDIVSRVHEALHSVARAIPFLQLEKTDEEEKQRLITLQRDVQSLIDHGTYLSSQVQFLLDSAVGLIGIQQNAIMKALSVATIFFMPPTLIAGIYGMNFQRMPELSLRYGYPCALLAMLGTAMASYWYLKRRKML